MTREDGCQKRSAYRYRPIGPCGPSARTHGAQAGCLKIFSSPQDNAVCQVFHGFALFEEFVDTDPLTRYALIFLVGIRLDSDLQLHLKYYYSIGPVDATGVHVHFTRVLCSFL